MTELEKKQSGRIYDARDPKLRKQQNRAKNLMRIYNNLPAEDIEEGNRVLSELLGRFGKNARVNHAVHLAGYRTDYHWGKHHDWPGCQNLYCGPRLRRCRAFLVGTGWNCCGEDLD